MIGDARVLGSTEQLPEIARRLDIERVIVAFSNDSHEGTLSVIRALRDLDVQIDIVPRLTHMAGLELGTGVHLNIVAPERAAADLREA